MGFDHLSTRWLLAINFTLCLFLFIGFSEGRGSRCLGATGGIREEREINYCLCLCLKQAVSKTLYEKKDKRGLWPLKLLNLRRLGGEHPVMSSDTQPSLPPVQNRPLSQLKMESSHFMCNQTYISDWWPQSRIWEKTAKKWPLQKSETFWALSNSPVVNQKLDCYHGTVNKITTPHEI